MEKIDLGIIKTARRTRKGDNRALRLFTKKQKEIIISVVESRPDGYTIVDILKMYEISPVVYYGWLKSKKRKEKAISKVKDNEMDIMNKINEIHDSYMLLENQHPSDLSEWIRAIHDLQKLIGLRILRRECPNVFVNHSLECYDTEK